MKTFYLARHGESQSNLDNICGGQLDTPLTPKGISQAQELANIIQQSDDIEFDTIIHSGLERAKHTALELHKHYPDLKFIEHVKFKEHFVGDWEGKPWAEPISSAWLRRDNPPQGETWDDFYIRINSAIQDAIDAYETPFIFAHAGVIMAAHQVLDIEMQELPHNTAAYKFTRIGDTDNKWSAELI